MSRIPDKAFYKVSEVCQYTETQPYVLRFWENEFPQLVPRKNRAGQKVYTRQDVELVLRIKRLLHDEEYTIAAARRRLEEELGEKPPAPAPSGPAKASRKVPGAGHEPSGAAGPSPGAGRGAGESVADFLPEPSDRRSAAPGDDLGIRVEQLREALAAAQAERRRKALRTAELVERALESLLRPLELRRSDSPRPPDA